MATLRSRRRIAVGKRLQVYQTPDIVVSFDPNLCTHSGVCLRGLPSVFDIRRKRWVRPERASPEAVAATVAECPSGALQIRHPGASGTTGGNG